MRGVGGVDASYLLIRSNVVKPSHNSRLTDCGNILQPAQTPQSTWIFRDVVAVPCHLTLQPMAAPSLVGTNGRISGLASIRRRPAARRQFISATSARSTKVPSLTARQACATWIAAAATAVDGTAETAAGDRQHPAAIDATGVDELLERRDKRNFQVTVLLRPRLLGRAPSGEAVERRRSPRAWHRGRNRGRDRSSNRPRRAEPRDCRGRRPPGRASPPSAWCRRRTCFR